MAACLGWAWTEQRRRKTHKELQDLRRENDGGADVSKRHLLEAIDSLSAGFALYDADRRLILHNQALEDLYPEIADLYQAGARFEDIVRTSVDRGLLPAAQNQGEKWLAGRINDFANPGALEEQHILDDRWVLIDGKVFQDGSIVNVRTDISDLKRAQAQMRDIETRYRDVFGFAPFPIYIHDGETIVEANTAAARVYGYPSPEEMIGLRVLNLIHPDDRDRYLARLKHFHASIEPLPFIEEQRVRKDGVVIRIVQSGTRIPWRGEHLILAMNYDVTREHDMEQQLRQAQKMEAVGQLSSGIAHDFNNLLAVIQGNIELLDRQVPPGSEYRQMTKPALRATARGASLTNRLLAFSRKQALRVEAIDVVDLLTEMRTLLARSISEDISIEIDLAADLWFCEADAGQLEQSIINLANNARDAMPDGGSLSISAKNTTLADSSQAGEALTQDWQPGDYVAITVSDTGAGMNGDILAKIFEPFFTTKDVGKGSGLGLSMVYGFIQQSGGHIEAVSEEAKGTTFTFYLPRHISIPKPTEPDETTEEQGGDANGEVILVVEDDPDVLTLTSTALTNLGYRIIEANSGVSALDSLQQNNDIDLLLTDIIMPDGISGPKLAQSAAEIIPHIKVLGADPDNADEVLLWTACERAD